MIGRIVRTLLLVLLLPQVGRADIDALINRDLVFGETILGQRAPAAIQRLIKDQDTVVTFVTDLPEREGKTHFQVEVGWMYDYRYRTRLRKDSVDLTITVTDLETSIGVRHIVRMPKVYYRRSIWKSQLLLHEFDHVAVSGHVRIHMLISELCANLPPLQANLTSGQKPTAKFCEGVMNRELNRRKDAVIALVRANYVLLDKVSDHGQRVVPNRKQFFSQLYTRDNLEKSRFPYLKQVGKLLDSDAYRRAKAINLAKDPTDR